MQDVFTLFLIVGIGTGILLLFVVIFTISDLYKKKEKKIEIIRDKDEIINLFCQYGTIFENHLIPDISESYVKVEKIITYRVKPRNPEFREIINEEVISINYYHKP